MPENVPSIPQDRDELLLAALVSFIDELPRQHDTYNNASATVNNFCESPPLGYRANIGGEVPAPRDPDIDVVNLCLASIGRPVMLRLDEPGTNRYGFVQVLKFAGYDHGKGTLEVKVSNGRKEGSAEVNASQLPGDLRLV